MAQCLTTQVEILVWMRKGIKDVMVVRPRAETARADDLMIMVEFPEFIVDQVLRSSLRVEVGQ